MLLEPPVSRTPMFIEAMRYISDGQFREGMDRLNTLRLQYENDPWSQTEIDRWILHGSIRGGETTGALQKLEEIQPRLERFQYDLSVHHFAVCQLLRSSGDPADLEQYCRNVRGGLRTNDALGHLDWIQYYADSGYVTPTEFMYTVIAVCAVQLGINVPRREVSGDEFRSLVEAFIELRDGRIDHGT